MALGVDDGSVPSVGVVVDVGIAVGVGVAVGIGVGMEVGVAVGTGVGVRRAPDSTLPAVGGAESQAASASASSIRTRSASVRKRRVSDQRGSSESSRDAQRTPYSSRAGGKPTTIAHCAMAPPIATLFAYVVHANHPVIPAKAGIQVRVRTTGKATKCNQMQLN